MAFRPFRLQPPDVSPSQLCHAPQLAGSPASAGPGFTFLQQARRSRPAESSSSSYGLVVHLLLLPTPPRGDAVTFGYRPERVPQGDSHPFDHARSQAHWGTRPACRAGAVRLQNGLQVNAPGRTGGTVQRSNVRTFQRRAGIGNGGVGGRQLKTQNSTLKTRAAARLL